MSAALILTSERWSTVATKADESAGLALLQPPNCPIFDDARSLVYEGSVFDVTDAGASWTYRTRLVRLVEHVTGYQYAGVDLAPVTVAQVGAQLIGCEVVMDGGVEYIQIATQATPLRHRFTIDIPDSRGRAIYLARELVSASGAASLRGALTLKESR